MATVVILPGGFHPYHAGHYALYQSAQRTFPDADIYVAATDDRSQRPFPFAIKEKLAQLAGVEPGHFVQVKSPFQAQEITKNYNPEQDVVIFVRSTKDAKQPPIPGGVKKDGKPAYLQPLLGAKKLDTFNKHAYMAYLPTKDFSDILPLWVNEYGDGWESASKIRAVWPQLDGDRKIEFVMGLYPRTQGNPRLAATVVKMLDTAIGSGVGENTVGYIQEKQAKPQIEKDPELMQAKRYAQHHYGKFEADPEVAFDKWVQRGLLHSQENDVKHDKLINFLTDKVIRLQRELEQSQHTEPTNEDYIDEKWSEKYKRSIDCSHPRGFSQRAHCAGRKK